MKLGIATTLAMTMPGTSAIATPAGKVGPARDRPGRSGLATLFLAGDVMLGRGIDQILPHPGDPRLYEPDLDSALDYVALAERTNGPIAKPVDFADVWGDALAELERRRPDVRIVNLETAVTRSEQPVPKGINYKMSPGNAPVLTALRLDGCTLANNHILDWGHPGLLETLETLRNAGVKSAGAGRNGQEAAAPAIFPVPSGRIVVFGFGSTTSGIPRSWAATDTAPGVNLLPDLSARTVAAVARQIGGVKRPGDLVVASIHWGGNWGYAIPEDQITFAHGLIDAAGVDVVHGHSSHHPKAMEVYRGKLVLYGCGDLLNDYEGIGGYEEFRDDLSLMYYPTLRASDGTLAALAMAPLQIRNFRLNRASAADAAWLRDSLNREGKRFGTRAQLSPDNALSLACDGVCES